MTKRGNKGSVHRRSSGVKTRLQLKKFIENNQVNPENLSNKSSDSKNRISTTSSGNKINNCYSDKMALPKPQILVGLINCFDGTKNSNIDNFLLQAEDLLNKTDYSNEAKVTILKCKITSSAKEKLMKDLSLFNETNLETFKTKLRDLFRPKINFSSAQTQFNSVKQKPGQTLTDFLLEFNYAADQMIKIAGDEANTSKITDQLKLTNFLKAIRSDISTELRKTCPSSFQEACDTALKLEEGFSQSDFFEINNIQVQQNSETLNTLIKIHSETSEQVQSLVTEVNNLKLRLSNSHSEPETKFCTFCKKQSHYVEQCWKKNGNKYNQSDNSEDRKTFLNVQGNSEVNYQDNNFQVQRYKHQNYEGPYPNAGNYAYGYQNYPPPGPYATPYNPYPPFRGHMGEYNYFNPTPNYQAYNYTRHNGYKGENNQHKKKQRSDHFSQKDSRHTDNNDHKNRAGSSENKQHKKNPNKNAEN